MRVYCSYCRTRLFDYAHFCSNCRRFQIAIDRVTKILSPTAGPACFCAICGRRILVAARYCFLCGEQKTLPSSQEPLAYCIHCGHEARKVDHFCTHCGKYLADKIPSEMVVSSILCRMIETDLQSTRGAIVNVIDGPTANQVRLDTGKALIQFTSYPINGLTLYAAVIPDLASAHYTVQLIRPTDEFPRLLGSQSINVPADKAVPLRWRLKSS